VNLLLALSLSVFHVGPGNSFAENSNARMLQYLSFEENCTATTPWHHKEASNAKTCFFENTPDVHS